MRAPRRWAALAGLAALTAGCAVLADGQGGSPRHSAGAAMSSAPACSATIHRTLRTIAMRVYDQAAGGQNVADATRRVAGSSGLAHAVARGDARATRAALRPLLKAQIHRIVVTRGARVLADVGTAPALAPVHGVIRDAAGAPVGRYTMAVNDRAAVVGIIHGLTGARVLVRGARRPPGGRHARTSFAATAFPSGARRIWLVFGPSTRPCASSPRQTVAQTIAAVGRRLYGVEAGGPSTRRALRHVAHDRRFLRAVAHDDPIGLRAAIVRFFRIHALHMVRVRATLPDGHLIGDVGGPLVLAPASTTLHDRRGRVLGRVTLSVQDDTGYAKLMHRFTGAGVVLRTRAGAQGRAGTVTYRVGAFPTGALSVTLMIRS
jgi:hypothetical protein